MLKMTFLAVAALLCFSTLLVPKNRPRHPSVQTGLASFYDDDFDGERTASGRRFDPDHLVAAHPKYPAGTVVRVTNLKNKRSVNVEIIDRGPSPQNRKEGVIIDLSRRAAERLGFTNHGKARVRIEVVKWGTSGAAQGRR